MRIPFNRCIQIKYAVIIFYFEYFTFIFVCVSDINAELLL